MAVHTVKDQQGHGCPPCSWKYSQGMRSSAREAAHRPACWTERWFYGPWQCYTKPPLCIHSNRKAVTKNHPGCLENGWCSWCPNQVVCADEFKISFQPKIHSSTSDHLSLGHAKHHSLKYKPTVATPRPRKIMPLKKLIEHLKMLM